VRRKLAAGAIATALAAAAAWANWNDTSTGIDLTQLPAFPLTKVRSGWLRDREQVRFDGLTATMIGPTGAVGEVSLQGASRSGKRWTTHFRWIAFDHVYRGDPDANGTQDYIVFGSTGNTLRRTPPRGAIVLLLDRQGLPVPFSAGLYDELGPEHVVDLNHNGRAGLLVSTPDEEPWDNRSGFGCSGHWVTDVYEAADLNWREFKGPVAGLTFPFVLGWTDGPQCNPPGPSEPWKPNIRTGQCSTASADVTSARVAKSSAGWVDLAPASKCQSFNVGTVIYDQRSRREIAIGWLPNYQDDLLARIQADKADVTLRGVYRQPDGKYCSANLLWATK